MDNRSKKKIAPIVIAILVVLYVGPIVVVPAVAAGGLLGVPDAGAVVPFLLLYAFVGGAVIVGVLCAMAQRLREIDGGEEDEARKY